MHAMLEAVRQGATDPLIERVDVVVRAALEATATDVLVAAGYIVGSPGNLGYMSGALKHFFDTIYYPCIESTIGRPFGVYLHGSNDTTGARRAVDTITTGLRWRKAAADVVVTEEPSRRDLDACVDLGGTLAPTLMTPPL